MARRGPEIGHRADAHEAEEGKEARGDAQVVEDPDEASVDVLNLQSASCPCGPIAATMPTRARRMPAKGMLDRMPPMPIGTRREGLEALLDGQEQKEASDADHDHGCPSLAAGQGQESIDTVVFQSSTKVLPISTMSS